MPVPDSFVGRQKRAKSRTAYPLGTPFSIGLLLLKFQISVLELNDALHCVIVILYTFNTATF